MSRLSMEHPENIAPPGGPSRLDEPAKSSAGRDRSDNLPSKL